MNRRVLSVVSFALALLATAAGPCLAENGPSPAQEADWAGRMAKAEALQAEGKARQVEADRVYDEKFAACYKKFLVISCQKDAKAELVAETRAARLLENEGKAIERQVKKEQLSDKDLRRIDQAPQREVELQARESETAAARQEAVEKEAATRADKAVKAEEGSRRKAADEERLRKRQEEHAAKVAKKKADAERRAVEAASK